MKQESKKAVPAYTTYTAYTNLIKDLRENGMPDHITRSVIKGSNSGKAMMMASLKYLNLINSDHTPSDALAQLVDNEEDYSKNLKKLLEAQYPFLFDGSLNIHSTTTEKVTEKFKEQGATGSTVSKSIAFFLGAAKAANIDVSARVKAPPIPKSTVKRKIKELKVITEDKVTPPSPPEDDDFIPDGMERITVPLRGMEDGIIYFPEDLDKADAKRALKTAKFILEQYYELDEED